MRRSQTGLRPGRGQAAARARHRKPMIEGLEQRALMAAAVPVSVNVLVPLPVAVTPATLVSESVPWLVVNVTVSWSPGASIL